jgi:hypothetical protein
LRVVVSSLVLATSVFACHAGTLPAAETWTDASGAYQVEAEFLGIRGTDVYLKNMNGVTLKVPMAKLSAASQQLARQLAAAQRPAPPAGAADTPDAAANALLKEIEAGNLRAVWDALPASYQSDVNDIVHTFAENMDAELWNSGATFAQKAVRVLKEKKSFVIASLMANAPVPANQATIDSNWDPVVDVLATLVNSEIADLQKLKTMDIGAFLNGTGRSIATQLAAIAKAAEAEGLSPDQFPGVPVDEMPMPNLSKAKITTVQSDGDTATIRIDDGEKVEEHEVVRVDGKWLPKEMVDGWPEAMAQAKLALTTNMPGALQQGKILILPMMQQLEIVLDQLLAAETQEAFDQVVKETMEQMMPRGGEGGPMPPGGGDPFGAPPAGGADPFGAPPAGNADPFGE